MKPTALALLLTLTAWPAVAADMLPLKRGIYVDVSTPCKGAPNADTLSYWGADNGINAQKVVCRIDRLGRKGDTFALQRSCQVIDGKSTFKDPRNVKIVGQSAFQISHDASSSPAGPVYRYCGSKVVF